MLVKKVKSPDSPGRFSPVLDWADRIAHRQGFAGVTVGCEPTGHRWMVLDQLGAADDVGV
jgi:hypothetical protein